jgi:putative PIN family toxin of toxin-antitoxin system
MKVHRVILDTNLWISFLISNRHQELDEFIESGNIKLVFSKELVEEFLAVASRPKFKKYFKKSDVNKLMTQIENFGELIIVSSNVNKCRDEKDNFLLSLSIDGKADFLITGDSDLLILDKINQTKILSWSDFIAIKK